MGEAVNTDDRWAAIRRAAVERMRRDRGLADYACDVGAAIADHPDFAASGEVRISAKDLADLTGWGLRSVRRAIPALKDHKWYVCELMTRADGAKNCYRPGPSFEAVASALGAQEATAAARAGRHMFLLQRWGASAKDARALVERLVKIAGPARHAHVDELFAKMEARWRWDDRRKVAWLQAEADRMARHPLYWPAARAPKRRTVSDAVIEAIKAAGGRATKTDLIDATGKSAASIADQTVAMVRAGLIVRTAPGEFMLPRPDAMTHVGAREAILAAFEQSPDGEATIAALMAVTGKPRSALDAAIFRMVGSGELVRVKRGVFALPRQRRSA